MLSKIVPRGAVGSILWICLIWQLLAEWASLVSGLYGSISIYSKVDVVVDVWQAVRCCAGARAVWVLLFVSPRLYVLVSYC